MKNLKSVSFNLESDSTGTTLGAVRANCVVNSTEYPEQVEYSSVSMQLSSTDESNAQTLFNDLLAQIKASLGIV